MLLKLVWLKTEAQALCSNIQFQKLVDKLQGKPELIKKEKNFSRNVTRVAITAVKMNIIASCLTYILVYKHTLPIIP
jgi:hypothetical protein